MSSESHGVLTERTSCAIHAFPFFWQEFLSWFPFQIVLWTFYQYEVIVTQYIRLVIQAIQSSVCHASAPSFQKMGYQKIESLCASWWSWLLVVFLFSSSCSIDQKAVPRRFLIRVKAPSLFRQKKRRSRTNSNKKPELLEKGEVFSVLWRRRRKGSTTVRTASKHARLLCWPDERAIGDKRILEKWKRIGSSEMKPKRNWADLYVMFQDRRNHRWTNNESGPHPCGCSF